MDRIYEYRWQPFALRLVDGRSLKRLQRGGLFFVGWMLALAGWSVAEPVDPRFPSELRLIPVEEWSRRPWVRIRELETERDQLLKKISVLPQYDPNFLSDHLGYHSLFEDPDSGGLFPPIQIKYKGIYPPLLGSIALAPAFNPSESEGKTYAFPKRFKIEVLDAETDQFETVVNWMEDDFPDPGPYPVFFSEINRHAKQVRIIVPRIVRESGVAFYAFGEIYLFQKQTDNRIGANMTAWSSETIEISVSNSFSMPPLWDAQYLYDGVEGFGFPLSDETVAKEDLFVAFKEGSAFSDKVQFMLDLGRLRPVGRIDFWPAAAPHLLALPSFGFPENILVEVSPDPGFETAKEINVENIGGDVYRNNLISVFGEAYPAQYIRITVEGLRTYKGERILGMGEISVSSNEEVWSVGSKITAKGIPEEYLDQLPRLVDGFSRQRRILPQGEWIKGLAQRRPIDRRLAVVERELDQARTSWRTTQLRISIWGGSAVFAGLIIGMVLQRLQRRGILDRLKWRITRDLHDDVGSILGGISFSTEQLKHVVEGEKAKEGLYDLSLMASEACASLREVVWVIDASTIRLPMLIEKLQERADRVLRGAGIAVETSVECPDCIVSLTYKRNLIMFFKEVVHNCARHAKATQVWVDFSVVAEHLQVSIRDNGCGFDPSNVSDGWGLDSLKERAGAMGGKMDLNTRLGEGTSVVLTVPLSALLSKTDHLYKTSN